MSAVAAWLADIGVCLMQAATAALDLLAAQQPAWICGSPPGMRGNPSPFHREPIRTRRYRSVHRPACPRPAPATYTLPFLRWSPSQFRRTVMKAVPLLELEDFDVRSAL